MHELDRLDNSLVIAHADHGAYDPNSKAGTHSAESVSLGALLLIKPIGAHGEMTVSAAKSTLVDVASHPAPGGGRRAPQFKGEGSLLREALPDAPLARLD